MLQVCITFILDAIMLLNSIQQIVTSTPPARRYALCRSPYSKPCILLLPVRNLNCYPTFPKRYRTLSQIGVLMFFDKEDEDIVSGHLVLL
jgi:hypothetical protein